MYRYSQPSSQKKPKNRIIVSQSPTSSNPKKAKKKKPNHTSKSSQNLEKRK